MNTPCGCRIVYDDAPAIFPKNDRIEFCPLHAEAEEMYKALSKAYRLETAPCGKCWDIPDGEMRKFHPQEFDALPVECPCECHLDEDWGSEAKQALKSAGFQMPADDSEMPLGLIKAPVRGLES